MAATSFEIVDEVGHDMRGTRLFRKPEVIRCQHVTIQSQSNLHIQTFQTKNHAYRYSERIVTTESC